MSSEWREAKLIDATTKIGSGATPRGGKEAYKEEGISLIRSQNVHDFKFSIDGLAFIDDDQADKLKNVIVAENDVLVNITGDSVARVCSAPKEYVPARVNQHVAIIRPDADVLNWAFLKYFLLSPYQKATLLTLSSSGATRNALTKSMLENLKINLPPLPEQKAIAHILGKLDDKIELNRQMNQTLEQMAQALFQSWFVDEADEDWEDVGFDLFFDFLEGPGIRNWQYTDEGTRFINIRLIRDGEVHIKKSNFVSDKEAHGKYKHFLLREKDMIVSTSGTLGKVAVIRSYHLPLMLNTSVIRFRPRDEFSFSFMYQYLQSKRFKEELEAYGGGSVQKNFGPTHLRKMRFTMPSAKLLSVYSARVDCLYEKINNNYLQINTLTQLRDTLLPQLISGKLSVPAAMMGGGE